MHIGKIDWMQMKEADNNDDENEEGMLKTTSDLQLPEHEHQTHTTPSIKSKALDKWIFKNR